MVSQQELEASVGLNVTGYPGKWKKAQELAQANQRKADGSLLPYWERVRLLFLELGGDYDRTNLHLP